MHTHLEQDRPPAVGGRPLSATLLCSALAIVVASYLTSIAPIGWAAMQTALSSQEPLLGQCAVIAGEADRLACFDQRSKQALQQPAKGANAPSIR